MRHAFHAFSLALAALALSLAAGPASAQNGKGKPSGGDDPTPPPILYQLQRLPMPADYLGGTVSVLEANIHGEIVGYYPQADNPGADPGFYYDSSSGSGVVTNLNDIAFAAGFDIPTGWYVDRAMGINRHGDIAAALAMTANPDRVRGCVIELRPNPLDPTTQPRLHLLPDEQWSKCYARRINDAGVVLGGDQDDEVYSFRPPLHGIPGDTKLQIIPVPMNIWYDAPELTNPLASGDTLVRVSLLGQIVAHSLTSGNTQLLDMADLELGVRSFNDAGQFCGSYAAGKKKRSRVGFLFDGALTDIPNTETGHDINDSSDVICTDASRRAHLYHPLHGVLPIDSTVVAANSQDQAIWENSSIFVPQLSERDDTDFPMIVGTMRRFDTELNFDYEAFVLTPLP